MKIYEHPEGKVDMSEAMSLYDMIGQVCGNISVSILFLTNHQVGLQLPVECGCEGCRVHGVNTASSQPQQVRVCRLALCDHRA